MKKGPGILSLDTGGDAATANRPPSHQPRRMWLIAAAIAVFCVLTLCAHVWLAWHRVQPRAAAGGAFFFGAREDGLLAEFEGRRLYADALTTRSIEVGTALRALYDAQKKEIDAWISEQILEKEASAHGMNIEGYLTQNIRQAIPPPTEREIDDFIAEMGAVYPDPVHQGELTKLPRERARDYLLKTRQHRAIQARVEQLKQKYKWKVYLHAPRPDSAALSAASAKDRPFFGALNAKVSGVLFVDFQCPYSRHFVTHTLSRIRALDGDRLHLKVRDYPMSYHKEAFGAAIAAKCADRQGKYWDYVDGIFEEPGTTLDRPRLITLARHLGLDRTAFETCLNDPELARAVEEDIEAAKTLNVRGTPTLILNGEILEGAVTYHEIQQKLDQFL